LLLEWGSGGSTLVFGKIVSSVVSIEHDCAWAMRIREKIAKRKLEKKVKLICASVPPSTGGWGQIHGFEHGSYRQFQKYVDAIDDISRMIIEENESHLNGSNQTNPSFVKFDKVLIDGRARMACALKILPYLKPTSVVFVHDFYTRTHLYGGIMEYYDEIARVLASPNYDPRFGPLEEPQGLVVLKRKTQVTDRSLPIRPSRINAMYDGINYRGDDPSPPLTGTDRAIFKIIGYVDLRNWKRIRTQSQLRDTVHEDVGYIIALLLALYSIRFVLDSVRKRTKGVGGHFVSRSRGSTLLPTASRPPRDSSLNRGKAKPNAGESRTPLVRHRTKASPQPSEVSRSFDDDRYSADAV